MDGDRDRRPRETVPALEELSRRQFATLAAGLAVPLAGCGGDEETTGTDTESETATETTETSTETQTLTTETETQAADDRYGDPDNPVADPVGLETVAEGLESPVAIEFPPDADVSYVATRPGEILLQDDAGIREEPLLDISDTVLTQGEQGLLGIALHPEFTDNDRLFVRYSAPSREGTPADYSHTFVVAEFEVSDDRTSASRTSERTIMEIPEPHDNHNAGDLAFGPEGYLYVPTGDGGNQFDVGPHRPEDWYEFNDGGNGQDTQESLLGGMLRIDVDDTDGDGYSIPPDNPLVDMDGHRDEYYAWGLRNPFRMSFDDGDLLVGNVGEHQWESVCLVENGGNYGWNVKEGSHCFDASDDYNTPESCPDRTPPDVRGGEPLRDPILEYLNARNAQLDTDEHLTGAAVVGGYVYRGSSIPELEGRYVFGDLAANGRLFVGTPATDAREEWSMGHVELTADAAGKLTSIWAFGRDPDGEMYVISGDALYRIVPGST